MEDFGYPVIPFLSRIIIKKSRKEDDSYGCYLSNIDLYYLYRNRVTYSKRRAIPLREEKLGGAHGD